MSCSKNWCAPRKGGALLIALSMIALGCQKPNPIDVSTPAKPASPDGTRTTIQWAGHTWNVSVHGIAGHNQGSASNVLIDADGALHLRITRAGNAWTCAELFTQDKLGFGTYQWHVDGPIDRFDHNVVLGLFPYGPIAGIGKDGTNEIDIEYSRWGHQENKNVGDWTVYPNSGTKTGEKVYAFTLSGTQTTSRFRWTQDRIEYWLMDGFQPIGTTGKVIDSWVYKPEDPNTNIPQQPLPLGMNLWLFKGVVPSDGKDVEIVIRSFQKID